MNARRYLVVVAEGNDSPDLATLSAFIAEGTQAIAYHPGIWHHPMIALDAAIDFVCVVFDDGTADDCVEANGLVLPRVRL
jgi:ureidoglycolate lyase